MLAKDFSLPDQNGTTHSLSQYRGKWVILYFYPEDDTPGCTKEACNFRDSMRELKQKGVVVLGVSKDSVESHKKFAHKYDLNFTILSDQNSDVITTYQAVSHTGTKARRMTYLLNPEGEIAKVYEKVNPAIHKEEILKDLMQLQ